MSRQPLTPERDILAALRADGPLDAGTAVLVLCSGGRDSVCLLDAVVRVCGTKSVGALHVNYALRGTDSEDDELFVRALCASLGVALHVERASVPPQRGNLQAWARDLRYGLALRLAAPRAALIATAHTASDQAETILYRLAASPGRRALLGMPARDGLLLRPLLGVTRVQTAAYCRARGLAWREDASNDSAQFARGRTRTRLLPALRDIHPAAEANVLRTAELLRDEAAVLDAAVAEALGARSEIATAELASLPPALARLAVVALAERVAGRPVPTARRRLGELIELGTRGGSAALDVGGGVRALVEYGILRFERLGSGGAPAPAPVVLPVPGSARFGRWHVETGVDARSGDALDGDAIARGLVVRAWRAGDRMRPAGHRGTRSLVDLFGEKRIARSRRAAWPVVVCGDAIAWVPGVACAERFRARGAGHRCVAVRAWV